MAGYKTYDEASGEVVHRMYEQPFVVRCTPKPFGMYDRPEGVTITAFRTQAEADEFIARCGDWYTKGPNAYAEIHVENWNL